MNHVLTNVVIAGAIISLTASIPVAHGAPDDAGQVQYVIDLSGAGIPLGAPAQEVYVGQLICANLADGLPIVEAVQRLITGAGVPTTTAIEIVSLAVVDMCPQYAPSGTTRSTEPLRVTIADATHDMIPPPGY
jgi:hypothetical protein